MIEGQSVETEVDGLSMIGLSVPFPQAFDVYNEIPELPEAIGSHSFCELASETGAQIKEVIVAMFPQRLQSVALDNELNPLFNNGVAL